MKFITFEEVVPYFKGKTVAVVGSGPGCLDNAPGFIEKHDVVVRVNNYRTGEAQGMRTDVHYSFYGNSIRKTADELKLNGVKLCLCKCPNSKAIDCAWHERMGKQEGVDYRYIYRNREAWWFVDTFIPTDAHYLKTFEMLGKHIPTTGFSAILDVLACQPGSVYLTGFDFFKSGVHNVSEPWRPGHPDDPICHRPDLEAQWIFENATKHPLSFDRKMRQALSEVSQWTV